MNSQRLQSLGLTLVAGTAVLAVAYIARAGSHDKAAPSQASLTPEGPPLSAGVNGDLNPAEFGCCSR